MKADVSLKTTAACLVSLAAAACAPGGIENIREEFSAVPSGVRTGVYWYWINDNVTCEGVERDLEAMKAVGIDRVQIGNIQADEAPSGPSPFYSDRWWEVTRAAVAKASELGVELGQFNSPGWSQSGGPWISEEQAMRYVAFKDTVLDGDGSVRDISLPPVNKSQIISIYAYREEPVREECFTASADSAVILDTDMPLTLRTLSIRSDAPFETGMTLFADGKPVKSFLYDRENDALNVGFIPHAPVVESIPEVVSSHFKLLLDRPSGQKIEVVLSEGVKVERYPEKTLAKLCPNPAPMWDYYMWEPPMSRREAPGTVATEQMVDLNQLSEDIAEGNNIRWEVPEGRWKVSVAYMKPTGIKNAPATPEATGLEVDKMNRKHIRYHFDSYLGDMLRRIPKQERRTFDLSIMDSYEMGGQNWTDDMRERFITAYGYDPLPYLPAIEGVVVNSAEESERFLWDLRRLVADLVATEYVGGLAEVCHEHGLETWLECYGHWGFPGEFLLYGGHSDQISGEFWSEGDLGDIENRAASSCGHIYGKNLIWSESCTAGGPQWHRSPRDMKARIDRFFTEGINSTILHVYISQPDDKVPGLDAWFGNEFNRHNTWFPYMDLFTGYLKRCGYLLRQGRYVAQVAYFIGEDAPKMTGVCHPALPAGYSFDYINADILRHHARVRDGKLCLDSGMEYDVLVLPDQGTMRPEMLECIAGFVDEGLAVTGTKPSSSPSLQGWPECDSRVRTTADRLWDSGLVYPHGTSLESILTAKGIKPDFTYVNAGDPEYAGNPRILFIHRTIPGDSEIYFISNQNDEKSCIHARFDIPSDMEAELWDPVSGRTRPLALDREDGAADAYMVLDSLESAFVVFSKAFRAPSGCAAGSMEERELCSPWTVTFRESAGHPAFEVTVDRPTDWSLSEDERIKYFSGTAEYRTSFTLSPEDLSGESVTLDLGKVMIMCRVRVNGEEAGGLWTPPYTMDITDYVCAGENALEVDVVNNWQNRLIGDSRLPVQQRGTWTNVNPWDNPDAPLQSSGIIGKVKIKVRR